MKRLTIIATAVALVTSFSAPVMANGVSIEQFGFGNAAGGGQVGTGNLLGVFQNGAFNNSITDQFGHVVHGLGTADVPAKLDLHLSDDRLPVVQDLRRIANPGDLERVVAEGLLPSRDHRIDSLFAVFERVEELVAPSEQEPAHAGLHVDGRGYDARSIRQDRAGVVDPLAGLLNLVDVV